MLAARLCRLPLASVVGGVGQVSSSSAKTKSCMFARIQKYANQPGSRFSRRSQKQASLKEKAMAPGGETAISVGQGALAGASALGVGALCYYGLGMSSKAGAIDNAILWTDEVKQRIRSTYTYFAGSVGITAVTAVAVSRTPMLMNLAMKNSWVAIGVSLAAMIGSGIVCRSIEYSPGFGTKQMAWLVHSGVMGMFVAPLTLLGGPLLVRAAWYTAGIVGGLSAVAICAPSEKFLNMGGPLAIGLGLVFASNIGAMFLPAASALGTGLYAISMYGGLIVFGGFLLYDTQKIIKSAELHPTYGGRPYDPINHSIGIYLDTLNIFIRVAILLSGGGGRKK